MKSTVNKISSIGKASVLLTGKLVTAIVISPVALALAVCGYKTVARSSLYSPGKVGKISMLVLSIATITNIEFVAIFAGLVVTGVVFTCSICTLIVNSVWGTR